MNIPTKTTIDARTDLDDDAKKVLKAIYLASLALEEAIAHGVTPIEAMNSAERLRQAGFIQIVAYEDETGETRYELKPLVNIAQRPNRQARRQKIRRRSR